MRSMSMIAMAITLTATSAMAQAASPDIRHDMMQMMGSGMMGMDAGATMILKMKESLELSGDQVQRLTKMQKAAQAEVQQHTMEGMHAMHAAEKLLDVATPDLKVYEVALRGVANHMILAHTGMARADMDAQQVLTAQQRDRLAFARKIMKEMQEGMEKEGMMMEKMMEKMKKDGSR